MSESSIATVVHAIAAMLGDHFGDIDQAIRRESDGLLSFKGIDEYDNQNIPDPLMPRLCVYPTSETASWIGLEDADESFNVIIRGQMAFNDPRMRNRINRAFAAEVKRALNSFHAGYALRDGNILQFEGVPASSIDYSVYSNNPFLAGFAVSTRVSIFNPIPFRPVHPMNTTQHTNQIGIHIGEKPWTEATFSKLKTAGLYDRVQNVLRIDAFDYTQDPINDYILVTEELGVAATWKASGGVQVQPTFRMMRTRGDFPNVIPSDPVESQWLADDMFRRLKIMKGNAGCWNEPTAGWDGIDNTPERHADLVHRIVEHIQYENLPYKLLCPSIPTVTETIDQTYLSRFLAALPSGDLRCIVPDFHFYISCSWTGSMGGVISRAYTGLQQCLAICANYGLKPSDVRISECGPWYLYGGLLPSDGQRYVTMMNIAATLRAAGVQLKNCSAYWASGGDGLLEVFNGTSLTQYGLALKNLMSGS